MKLEEALRFHNFSFEMDNEVQWIREREPAARSQTLGQDLHTAQMLDKKHKKLEAELTGHQPAIDHSLANGHNLIEQHHPQKDKVFYISLLDSFKRCQVGMSSLAKLPLNEFIQIECDEIGTNNIDKFVYTFSEFIGIDLNEMH